MRKKKSPLRRTIRAIFTIGIVVVLIHVAHALTLDRIIQYREVSFASQNLPAEMDGYRIAFITDTHNISAERLSAVTRELNNRQIDLLLLGGDFGWTQPSISLCPHTLEILSAIQTTDGAFGVAGNHDNHNVLFPAMRAHGITPLPSSGVHIREGFFLANVWNLLPGDASLADVTQETDFVLLLSHNPDISMRNDTTGVDLILSGHTHGGQITFLGLWAPALTHSSSITNYGQRFMSGWAYSRDGTPVFVSNGTGEYRRLPRVFARPQVIVITLLHTY